MYTDVFIIIFIFNIQNLSNKFNFYSRNVKGIARKLEMKFFPTENCHKK